MLTSDNVDALCLYLDDSPEIKSVDVVGDGEEIIAKVVHEVAGTSELNKALKLADSVQIDFQKRLIRFFFVDEFEDETV